MTGDDAKILAAQAMKEIRDHVEECRERYRQIVANQNISAQDRVTFREQMHQQEISVLKALDVHKQAVDTNVTALGLHLHNRISNINNRILTIALSIVAFETVTIIGVVAWFMNFKMTNP